MKYLPLTILLSLLIIISFATIQISNIPDNLKKADSANDNKLQDDSFREVRSAFVASGDLAGLRRVRIALPDFSLSELFSNHDTFGKQDLVVKNQNQDTEESTLKADQQNLTKSNITQKKYSLVVFFASWCSACTIEHEFLMRLKDENAIEIYGIAWRDIDKETKEFLKKYGNPYKKIGVDSSGLFTKIAAINAIPETWIVDNNGIVVMRLIGAINDEYLLDRIRNFVQTN